mgnify:FL=1|jgi:hypothetical protein|tara:strand:+ start:272 stop:484 length:213 start_codon:yes stop_codon:yes gene_type:complete
MIHFIFWGTLLIFILLNALINKVNVKKEKIEEDKLMKDLKYLQRQLILETNPNKRIEIMKKIELISSIYN